MVSFEGIRSLWCVHLFTISLYVANTNGYLLEQKMFSQLNNFKHSGRLERPLSYVYILPCLDALEVKLFLRSRLSSLPSRFQIASVVNKNMFMHGCSLQCNQSALSHLRQLAEMFASGFGVSCITFVVPYMY